MSANKTIRAAYAAFGRNDPSVLFAAMDPAISWNEAEGSPLADRNPYVGAHENASLCLKSGPHIAPLPTRVVSGGTSNSSC